MINTIKRIKIVLNVFIVLVLSYHLFRAYYPLYYSETIFNFCNDICNLIERLLRLYRIASLNLWVRAVEHNRHNEIELIELEKNYRPKE